MQPYILYITVTQNEANTLALKILSNKLAACIQLENIDSLYVYNDQMNNLSEKRMVIKTFDVLINKIEKLLSENHSYEVYQCTGVKMDYVNEKYLKWMTSNVDV